MSSQREVDGRIYVGNLPPEIKSSDLEDIFYKFGRINFVDLKNGRGPPFAFIEFDDPRDATDAVRYRDGYEYKRYTLRVEFPKNALGRGNEAGRGYENRRGGYESRGGGGGFRGGGRGGGGSRRSDYRVLVSGLPSSGSWQDLKDHMREAGDVCFADVYKDGTGVVEFLRREDMKYAVKNLDESKFRSHEAEVSILRVKEDSKSGGSGDSSSRYGRDRGSRSPVGRGGRGSPTYSPVRHSRSRSRSGSPY